VVIAYVTELTEPPVTSVSDVMVFLRRGTMPPCDVIVHPDWFRGPGGQDERVVAWMAAELAAEHEASPQCASWQTLTAPIAEWRWETSELTVYALAHPEAHAVVDTAGDVRAVALARLHWHQRTDATIGQTGTGLVVLRPDRWHALLTCKARLPFPNAPTLAQATVAMTAYVEWVAANVPPGAVRDFILGQTN
jgi:hypothetical protein